MQKVFAWFLALACCVLLAVLGLYVVSRLMPIPVDEAAALAKLEEAPALPGRNGGAALWLLPYDVPAEQAEHVLAPEVARFAAMRVQSGEQDIFLGLDIDAERLVADVNLHEIQCRLRDAGCLQRVRVNLSEFEHQAKLRSRISPRVAALDGYDYFRNPFPPSLYSPLPEYVALTRDLSVHAYAFARGDTASALQGVCRDASIARKLVASGDNLIGSMIGVAMMDGAGRLFVEMLTELPPDYRVPAQCLEVFRADNAMASGICPTMMGEGRYAIATARSALQAEVGRHSRPYSWFLDVEKTVARSAPRATWYCEKTAQRQILTDQPLQQTSDNSPLSLRCLANQTGCFMTDVIPPDYNEYAWRLQDAEMRQKLVATWLWLRANAGDTRPLADRLASRPQALKSAAREIRISADGKALLAPMYESRPEGDTWQLPIADWMNQPG